jgi:hypothetical protein
MAQFLERVEYKWTVNDYLDTPTGMIQFMRDYWQMTQSADESKP